MYKEKVGWIRERDKFELSALAVLMYLSSVMCIALALLGKNVVNRQIILGVGITMGVVAIILMTVLTFIWNKKRRRRWWDD